MMALPPSSNLRQVFTAFIAPRQETYVLFAAVTASALCLAGSPILRVVRQTRARARLANY